MSTTYEEMFYYFKGKVSSLSDLDLPSTPEEKMTLIRDAILEYNLRFNQELEYSDEDETINSDLTNNQMMIIAECMRLETYKKMLLEFVSVWDVFDADMGRKNYNAQVNARKDVIHEQERRLNWLVHKLMDDYDSGDD